MTNIIDVSDANITAQCSSDSDASMEAEVYLVNDTTRTVKSVDNSKNHEEGDATAKYAVPKLDDAYAVSTSSQMQHNANESNYMEIDARRFVEESAQDLSNLNIEETNAEQQLSSSILNSSNSNQTGINSTASASEKQDKPETMITSCVTNSISNEVPTDDGLLYDEFKEEFYFQGTNLEVGRRCWKSNDKMQCYLRGCLWSPDGTCLLVPVNGEGMHIIEVPTEIKMYDCSSKKAVHYLKSAVEVPETEAVYDCAWYPSMNSEDYTTCCWLSSRRNEPLHLWDAYTGEKRCSYRGYDEVDELEAAISVSFSNDGSKIYGGYKKSIKIFDTSIAGREMLKIPLRQAVSCFANPLLTPNECVFGSWSGVICLCDLRAQNKFDAKNANISIRAHDGGVTWLRFPPEGFGDQTTLFSGARKDNRLLQWDLRNFEQPVKTYQRLANTNQRIYFDISPQFNWLATGSTDGIVRFWDLKKDCADTVNGLHIHQDCCNGVGFNPILPLLATTSGQYHMRNAETDSVQDGQPVTKYENALVMTWLGPVDIHALENEND